MTSLTVSKSGTAWIRDMQAQGKSAADGWASSPNAAYYASLDTDRPLPKPSAQLPAKLTDLLKLHAQAEDEKDKAAADQLQRQINDLATAHHAPARGNLIDVKA